MRLLEPINGIKSMQGHFLMNLIFFLAMCFIKHDVETNMRTEEGSLYKEVFIEEITEEITPIEEQAGVEDEAEIEPQEEEQAPEEEEPQEEEQPPEIETQAYTRQIPKFEVNYLQLNSGGAEGGEPEAIDPLEGKEHELTVFHMMFWTHLASFIIIQLAFKLKSLEYYDMKQFLQFVLLTWYFIISWYTVYITKLDLHNWGEDINEIRVWLFIESSYVFKWILSSVIFVTLAQIFKFQSSLMSEDELEFDDDVWNDRNSSDFLRYIKHDFFIFVYICTHLINNLNYGFNDYDMDKFNVGPRDFATTGICFLILVFIRFNQLSLQTYKIVIGAKELDQIKDSQGYRITTIALQILNSIGAFVVLFIFLKSNHLEGQNLFCRQWIKVELLAFVCEIPYFYLNQVGHQNFKKSLYKDQGYGVNDSFRSPWSPVNKKITEALNEDQNSEERRKQAMSNQIGSSKKELEYEEDIVAMTVLSYLKTNSKKFMITPAKQSQLFYSCLIVHMIVDCLLFAMCYAISTNEYEAYTPNLAHTFAVWFVKFPCTLALHFVLCPEVMNGMNIMKFANNQPHLFVGNGSQISFILGASQVFSSLLCIGICIYMLAYQHTVQHCIIHFVALEVIMEVSNLYFESLKTNPLKALLHHPPEAEIKGIDIKFSERSCFHKCARVFYKILRAFQVGVIFYFIPFSVMWIQWRCDAPIAEAE